MLNNIAKPILKWAGGKTQMLGDLLPKVPKNYGRYIEPFFGGGAMFFALQPENAIIADSNPELINMYRQVATNVDEVIKCLKKYENTAVKTAVFLILKLQFFCYLSQDNAAYGHYAHHYSERSYDGINTAFTDDDREERISPN